jgi:pilus assembly protein CpaE
MKEFLTTKAAVPVDDSIDEVRSIAHRLEEIAMARPESARRQTMRIPHIRIEAFCDSPDVAAAIESAAADRLMSRAHVAVYAGGITAAILRYSTEPTPQLIVIESGSRPEAFLAQLDKLAEVCDPGTKVMAIGHTNDVYFYRELTKRGVSDYLLAPIDPVSLIVAVSGIYSEPASSKLGQAYAFVGAKGGVGSSTIAHNVGWTIANQGASDVVLADMD